MIRLFLLLTLMLVGVMMFLGFANYYEETGKGFLLMAGGLFMAAWSCNKLTKDGETVNNE